MSICANCGQRPGDNQWVGDGGALAYTHGWYAMWCDVCVYEAQLANARERAAAIPDLEAKLKAALAADKVPA